MSKLFSYVKGWRGIFLIAYMWFILMAYAIVYVDIGSVEMKRKFYVISVAETILIISIYICPKLLTWAENKTIRYETITQKEKTKFFLKTWLITFGIFFVMYIIFYPGGMPPDCVGQYSQAIGVNRYNDHHPVFHTLFVFTLPLKLTGGWIGSINLFQIIIFSFSLACMAYTLIEYSNHSYAKFFLIYIMLNPVILNMSVIPVKDTPFAIASLLLMIFAARTYFTNGKWLDIKHSIIFVLVMTACTLFRHNAILFTLPLLFAVSLYIKKRQAVLMLVCFLSLIYLIRYPLYESLNVERPVNNRQIETLGLPITIIGNAVKEAPEKLDDEVLDFAYSVMPDELWKKYSNIYLGFNSVKFILNDTKLTEEERAALAGKVDIQSIERAGWKKILRLTFLCFKEAPLESLRGMLAITNMVHGITGIAYGTFAPIVELLKNYMI